MSRRGKPTVAKAVPRTTYAARDGSHITDKQARVVGPVIERIAQASGGKASAADVLAEAARSTSPLHSFFEWNDTKAAHEHRLEQARRLIRSIEVRRVGAPEDRVRAFHVVKAGPGEGYAPIGEILKSVDMSAELLKRAKRELEGWAQRYARLRDAAELAGVFRGLEEAGIIESLPIAAE